MDPGRAAIRAKEANVSWFTRTRGQKSTDILEETERLAIGRCLVCRGRLRITGYEKRATSGNRLLTIVPLDVPPQVFETEGLWYVIPDAVRAGLEERFLHFMGSIHALEHALIGLLPLQVMADRNDFGGISIPLHPQTGLPCVFVYDGLPGGAGLTRQAFAGARELLEATRRVVGACPCEDGCPSCVHSPKCGSGNRPISKQGALALLDELLAPGGEGDALCRELRISPVPESLDGHLDGRLEANLNAGAGASPDIRPRETPGTPFANAPRQEKIMENSPATPASSPVPDSLTVHIPVPPPRHYVVFDVETRRSAAEVGGWHKAGQMGVSVTVLYDSLADDYFSYSQDELPALFERLRAAETVVGFNSLRFDYAVLTPFAPFELRALPSLDLLQRIKERLNYRISLDNLGQATLGEPKSADGLQALQWWKEGRCEEIAAYCRKDVDLTRRLYLFGLREGYLLFTNKAGQRVRVPVDFGQRP